MPCRKAIVTPVATISAMPNSAIAIREVAEHQQPTTIATTRCM